MAKKFLAQEPYAYTPEAEPAFWLSEPQALALLQENAL